LKAGGQLDLKGGEAPDRRWVTITKVEQEQKTVSVYNLEVAQDHTFFVGEEGVLVHNGRSRGGGIEGAGDVAEGMAAVEVGQVFMVFQEERSMILMLVGQRKANIRKARPERGEIEAERMVTEEEIHPISHLNVGFEISNLEKNRWKQKSYMI